MPPKKKKSLKSKETLELADGSQEWEIVESSDADIPHDDEVEAESERSSSALVPYSPLDLYLKEIARFKPLSKEEEHTLAVAFRETKDIEAAKRIIQSNLWLVVKIAREYQKAARHLLDLIQEGNMGLMEAIRNFDPFREVRFPTYAAWWIKAYIIRYLIANFRLVKLGTTQAQRKLFFNLQKEKEKLEREGFFPAPKLLAERLDVKESEIIEMEQRLGSPDVSVDAPLSEDGEADLLSVLPSESLDAEELLSREEMAKQLKKGFSDFEKTLNDKEKAIFHERLLSEEKVTLQELSDRFSISKERVRQLEEKIKTKLKAFLEEHVESEILG